MVPQSWAEKVFNIVEWHQHENGGHFPGYEHPDKLSSDIDKFLKAQWKR